MLLRRFITDSKHWWMSVHVRINRIILIWIYFHTYTCVCTMVVFLYILQNSFLYFCGILGTKHGKTEKNESKQIENKHTSSILHANTPENSPKRKRTRNTPSANASPATPDVPPPKRRRWKQNLMLKVITLYLSTVGYGSINRCLDWYGIIVVMPCYCCRSTK